VENTAPYQQIRLAKIIGSIRAHVIDLLRTSGIYHHRARRPRTVNALNMGSSR
jgi:hypothetical protein